MKLVALVAAAAVIASLFAEAPHGDPATGCRVTLPTSRAHGPAFGPGSFNYGTAKLRAQLRPDGKLRAGILPDGGAMAIVNDDGSIYAKQGWWRGVRGTLRVTGRRLDAAAPPLRGDVPGGYGTTGFNPVGLTFPTVGCWNVTGRIGRNVQLSYVVKVTKLRG